MAKMFSKKVPDRTQAAIEEMIARLEHNAQTSTGAQADHYRRWARNLRAKHGRPIASPAAADEPATLSAPGDEPVTYATGNEVF